ncbi:DUF58 domain-containing protein [Sporolactobacillus nakayamae]|uniref:DUF58 domain-containing protein n=1 Tax=Sporolactobacillus nakayamae TaxID=269670 RepID=A0A1I2TD46_9BACL|nr:DUF58 domain-containing protein [Sporolactobacillus nakayamae]SFG62768.1 Protein of unknown function DUF58 [Sporolactobacillus nakayamae]
MIGHWLEKGQLHSILRVVPTFVTAVVLFLFAIAQGGFLSWFLFYTFLPIALYLSVLLLYPFHSIVIVRSIDNDQLFSGDTLHLQIHLKRRLAFPLFLMSIYESPEGSLRNGITHTAGVMCWFSREVTIPLDLSNMPRGRHVLKSLVLKTGDPFGFFERSVQLSSRMVVYVYPKSRVISAHELDLPNQTADAFAQQADLSNFSGIRAYRPSDRPSRMDWKSTARTNTLVTKQFEPERERYVSIVLVSRKQESDERFERAISYTVSLVKTFLNYGFTVLLTYRSGSAALFLQDSSSRTLNQVYQTLAELTKQQVLEADEVRMSGNKSYLGYAVSTDAQLAFTMSEFAAKSRQKQKLFYITDELPEQDFNHLRSSWFSATIVSEKELKAGERD